MSKESVIQLIEATENDQKLLKQLYTAQGPETVLAIGAERGFQFSETELLAVMQEKQLSFASEELSSEELEAVAGGKNDLKATYNDASKTVYYPKKR